MSTHDRPDSEESIEPMDDATEHAHGGGISRRAFVTSLAAGTIGAAVLGMTGGCSPTDTEIEESAAQEGGSWADKPIAVDDSEIVETYEADIIVVGAGHAGTCAARAAAEAGATVIVLETQAEEAQLANGNELGTINAQIALDRGVERYSPHDFVRECSIRSLNRANTQVMKRFAENCGAHANWFLDPLNQEFKDSISIFMNPLPKYYPGSYYGMKTFVGTASFFGGEAFTMTNAIRANQELAKEAGAEFHFEVTAEQPIVSEEKVAGVIGRGVNDGAMKYLSKKGVILAGGGFSANEEMVRDLIGEFEDFSGDKPIVGFGRDGSAIKLGVWAGGRVEEDPRAAIYANQSGYAGSFGATAFLRLNDSGERYCDEAIFGPWGQGAASNRQDGKRVCAVFDADWREELEYQPPEHFGVNMGDPEMLALLEEEMHAIVPGPDGGKVHSTTWTPTESTYTFYAADTIEELAGYLGYTGDSAQTFAESITRYNELAKKGVDEDFGKEPLLMHAVETPPFYGFVEDIHIGDLVVTLSGLRVNDESQVVNESNEAIPGLYAVGNSSGGRFAVQYMTPIPGFSIGLAQVMGHLVGADLAVAGDIA